MKVNLHAHRKKNRYLAVFLFRLRDQIKVVLVCTSSGVNSGCAGAIFRMCCQLAVGGSIAIFFDRGVCIECDAR